MTTCSPKEKNIAPASNRPSEWRLLARDPWLLSLVSWIPPVLFLLMYAIFSQGLARDLPIGVVDLDQSRLSRSMIRYYDASPTLKVQRLYSSPLEGSVAMRGGEIYGLVIIEKDMEKDALLGFPPEIEVYYNSQFLLIGKLVKSALLGAHGTAVARIDTLKSLASNSPEIGRAMAAAVPVGSQMTSLYNSSRDYGQFLVSAIIPAIWQILVVAATVLSLAAELRRGGLSSWLAGRPVRSLLNKILPYTLLFWLHGIIFLFGMFVYAGWPMHGNFGFLVCSQLMTVCACQAVGALLFFLTRDSARALGMAAAYSAPGLAFMGVTFPATDMTLPARIWRSLLPVSHYIDIQIAQVNYGAHLALAMPQIRNLALFIVPALLVLLLAKKMSRLPQEEAAS